MNDFLRRILVPCLLPVLGGGCIMGAVAQDHAPTGARKYPNYLTGEEARAARLYQDVMPTVVTIFASRPVQVEGATAVSGALGSGVLISADGHVLTAAHVVEGAEEIRVKTHQGKLYSAELIFSELSADVALLRLLEPREGLPHADLGDSDRLAVGQTVYAIGSPYGLEDSFSVGHISGFREFGQLFEGTVRAEFIQTDAAINMGSSGGPLFNSKGEVIGIASRIVSTSGGSQGIGLVVTVNTAKELLALRERVWLGIEAVYLNRESLATLLNQDLEGALLLVRVVKGSPAYRAGLRGGTIPVRLFGRDMLLGGDLVVEFAGQDVCHAECLMSLREQLPALDRVPVKYLRAGKMHEAVIELAEDQGNLFGR